MTEWSLPPDLGPDLCAFVERPGAVGQPLTFNLLARLTEALTPGTNTGGKPYGALAAELAAAMAGEKGTSPVRASLLGERERRTGVAEGRAWFIERAMLANDTDLAQEQLERFEVEEAMTFEPSARRERGEYSVLGIGPVLAMALQRSGAPTAPTPESLSATGSTATA
ncbi:hypothetical protein [Roseomonas sp. WA12]